MKKIPTLFVRDEKSHLVIDQVTSGCEWVLAGEGVATRKWDGTCCMVRDKKLFKRHEIKCNAAINFVIPKGFEEVGSDNDKIQGWLPVGDGPEDRWHREAVSNAPDLLLQDGTYELIGPKIQGNPEGAKIHMLVRHGRAFLGDVPRTYTELKRYFSFPEVAVIEGVVWHHPDGRMAKIKLKDFGVKRIKQ